MQIRKEEVRYIEDTPVRIILDDEISLFRGRLPPHWHNEIEINLVLYGTVYYIVNGVSYRVSQDEMIIVDSSVIHSGRCCEGNTVEETHAEIMTLQINRDVLRYEHYSIPAFQVHLQRSENTKLRSIMMEIRAIYQQKMLYYELLLNAQLLKLCYCMLTDHCVQEKKTEASFHTAREMKRAIQYMEEHSSEKLRLEDVARLIHFNPSYFSRRFHQYTGFTFNKYLNRCRTNTASKLLLETNKTISEIALACGFPNVCSFITYFKRQYQMTPEKYRKNSLKSKDLII